MFSTLRCFEVLSGLKINNAKTRLVGVGDVPEIQLWASRIGFGVDMLPISYLGLPLGARYKSKHVWDPVIVRFEKRLSVWMKIHLSKGGRLVLIKSVLSGLPTYYFSLLLAPKSVILLLEKKMRDFLWSKADGSRGMHWVSWDQVQLPFCHGGLGIKNLEIV